MTHLQALAMLVTPVGALLIAAFILRWTKAEDQTHNRHHHHPAE